MSPNTRKTEVEGNCEGESSMRYGFDERQQLEHEHEHEHDDGSYSSILALGNLTLSDNHTDETRKPNESGGIASGSASVYRPYNGGMSLGYNPNFTGGQLYPQPALSFTAPNKNNISFQAHATLVDIMEKPYKYLTCPTGSRLVSALLDNPPTVAFIDHFVMTILQCKKSLIYAFCTHQGTLVIQKLIYEAKNRPVIAQLPLFVSDCTVLLMTNKCAMHAVKQCFVHLDYTKHRPLYTNLIENDNWLTVARDMTGCRGLNECINYLEHSNKYNLLARIAYNAKDLAMDVYGNYVLQHVIDMQTIYTSYIVRSLFPLLDNLCTIKNGSHLLEKCLLTPYFSEIVERLVKSPKLMRHATHEYANYVIQKALLRTQKEDPGLYVQLVDVLTKNKSILMANKHGRYVARLLPENRNGRTGTSSYYQKS